MANKEREETELREEEVAEDVDEDEDVDEEDEDEDEDKPRAKKARKGARGRRGAAFFLEDMAEVGSEDEDEEEDEEEAGYAELAAQVGEAPGGGSAAAAAAAEGPLSTTRSAYVNFQRRQDAEQHALTEEEIAARYNQRLDDEEYAATTTTAMPGFGRARAIVSQQALLPSVHDPKLYAVRCRSGHEREALLSLLHRRAEDPDAVRILSVVAPAQHTHGYIYVEATAAQDARDAVTGVRDVYARDIRIVPIKEMCDVLRTAQRAGPHPRDQERAAVSVLGANGEDVHPGDWARVKRGLYKGDLVNVLSVDAGRGTAEARVIPRVDFAAEIADATKSALVGDDTTSPAAQLKSHKRAQRQQQARPAPRLFNPEEQLQGHTEMLEKRKDSRSGETVSTFLRKYHFVGGFLIKTFASSSLDKAKAAPTPDELQRFQVSTAGSVVDDPASMTSGLAAAMTRAIPRAAVQYKKGDSVRVVAGDLRNMQGTVESVSDGIALVRMDDSAAAAAGELSEPLNVSVAQLAKRFSPGDHVKVVAGKLEGETGLVLRVDASAGGDVATILSDSTRSEVRAFAGDLQLSSEVAAGMVERAGYRLGDLVQLPARNLGMIVGITHDTFSVLDTDGRVQVLSLSQMGARRSSLAAAASFGRAGGSGRPSGGSASTEVGLDSQQRQISVGDLVDVVDGPYRGRHATVRHFVRHFAFVQANNIAENDGVFVVRSSALALVGADRPRANPPPFVARGRGAPADLSTAGRGKPAVGTVVTIKQGRWKGYTGVVKSATERLAHIELHANLRRVPIGLELLEPKSTASLELGGAGVLEDRAFAPPPTPMRDDALATPLRTPMTPSRDPWNPANPNIPQSEIEGFATPGYAGQSVSTPAYVPSQATATSGGYSVPVSAVPVATPAMQQPFTPGAAAIPSSAAATAATPSTPGSAFITATPRMEPLTPGASAQTPADGRQAQTPIGW